MFTLAIVCFYRGRTHSHISHQTMNCSAAACTFQSNHYPAVIQKPVLVVSPVVSQNTILSSRISFKKNEREQQQKLCFILGILLAFNFSLWFKLSKQIDKTINVNWQTNFISVFFPSCCFVFFRFSISFF